MFITCYITIPCVGNSKQFPYGKLLSISPAFSKLKSFNEQNLKLVSISYEIYEILQILNA